MKHEETAKRLRKAMELNNIGQRELSLKANIKEASVSQYYNGSHKPSNISAGKMGEVLNVNPMWLMGFDVPMENKIKFNIETDAEEHLMLIALYEELNESNREKVISYMKYVLHEQKGNN